MYITRIVIRNFRNFELLDVPIRQGITCVLGENNTGKSNLFHALRLALDVNLPSSFRTLTENDLHRCPSFGQAMQVLVSVEFSGFSQSPNECALCGLWEVSDDRARITYRFRPREAVREAIENEERQADALTIDDYLWELTGSTSDENSDPATVAWDENCGSAVRFQELQAFKVDFMPALRDVENDLRNSRISPLSRLISALDISQEQKDALVATIRGANRDVEKSPPIHAAGTAIAASFSDTAGEAFDMPVRLGMVAPTFASIQRSLGLLLSDRELVDFEPARNGLGLNNILYVSMLMEYFRRRVARPDTAGQLLLMEEPEAHLHPQLQRALYSKLHESDFQTLVSTHSTHISSGSKLESFVILTSGADMATHSMVPSGIPNLLPSLLRLGGWTMRAKLDLSYAKATFSLSPADQLKPIDSKEQEFDSSIESTFAQKWGSGRRDGWLLKHEDEILWRGQRSFVPDFSFSHEDGRKVLFEVAGYWTPEYESAKRETLQMFSDAKIILAVPAASADSYEDLGVPMIVYKSGIKLEPVLEALKRQ